ncbi:hypothetical protein ACA910_021350 [Epithemia clementina (nom. ined.)]
MINKLVWLQQKPSSWRRKLIWLVIVFVCGHYSNLRSSSSFSFSSPRMPFLFALADDGGGNNLYQILGVTRQASTQEIKRAYRKKALDTHPDKNPDMPAEEAAAAFHKVVQAFEVLSDPTSRRRYDQSGRTDGNSNNNANANNNNGGSQWQFHRQSSGTFTFTFNYQHQRRPPQRMKDKPEVQQAQARLLHIVSWEQFQTVLMMDNEDRLERHVLLAAVNPSLEKHVMDEMVFPYPFAGMSPQHIWWEDILQTVLIRYHNQNELTQKLKLPKGQEMTKPVFLLGKQGQGMDEPWSRLETNSMEELHAWVWQEIQVELQFINYHDHPVEIYWIDGTRAHKKIPRLDPGAQSNHFTRLTHEWYIRDTRIDSRPDSPGRWKLTPQSTLIQFTVLNATSPQTLAIPRRTCFDLSGHCTFWVAQGECTKNPIFMREQCSLSCEHCSDEQDQIYVEQAKQGIYVPPWTSADEEIVAPSTLNSESTSEKVHDEL